MATVPPDTASPQADLNEASRVLFDDPDADLILRSLDFQTFRVIRLYIIRSSAVLGGMIRAAGSSTSGSANSVSSERRLPELQLPDRSTILSYLITFIFPVPSILPSSLEEQMELLSVAQKYQMSSVIDHIRGSLSMQDPPFIRRENAFLAYSLAQRYGLHREAIQAARLTLKFTLTLEKFMDVMPGAYLHELWKYHKRVQARLKYEHDLSGTGAVLSAFRDFKCSQHGTTGPPLWVRSYVGSIAENPSFFDPIEFQMALMRHTSSSNTPTSDPFLPSMPTLGGCASCIYIPAATMRTFWTTLSAAIHRSIEQVSDRRCELHPNCIETIPQAEYDLSTLGTETGPQIHTGVPIHSYPLPECLDRREADVVIRSSDNTNFLVHKAILASSSSVFRDMFSLPQSPNSETVDGLPVVDISEDAELVRSLITILYPIPSELPGLYDRILALLAAAQKYDMGAVQASIRGEVARRQLPELNGKQAFRAYAIAGSSMLIPEMNLTASLTFGSPMSFEYLGCDLQLFEQWTLHDLASVRRRCRDKLVTCFESFLDPLNGPSHVWAGCHGNKAKPSVKDAIPTWVQDLFKQQIKELKEDFTRPLISPSSIRAKYLEALRRHAASGRCGNCIERHALKGEDYCVQLEQAIARAHVVSHSSRA